MSSGAFIAASSATSRVSVSRRLDLGRGQRREVIVQSARDNQGAATVFDGRDLSLAYQNVEG